MAAAGAATLVLLALNGEGLRQIVFGYSLGGALLRDLQGVVRETLQPASVDVWLAASSLPLRGRVGEGVGR